MSSLSSHFGVGDTRRSSIKSLAKMKINVSTVEQFLNVAQGIGDDNLAIRNEIYDACKEARSSIKLIDHLRQLASKQNQQQNQFLQSTRLSQLQARQQQQQHQQHQQHLQSLNHQASGQQQQHHRQQQHHHYYQQQLSLNQQQQFSYSNKLALIRASKSLVSSIGKILFLTDSIVVKQMLQCKDRNSIALSRLENVANYSELLRAFGLMSYELVDLGQCLLMFQFMSLPANHQQQIAANHHQQAMMAGIEASGLVDRRRFSHNNNKQLLLASNNNNNNRNWPNSDVSSNSTTTQQGRPLFWHHNKPASHTKAKLKLTEQLQDMQTLFSVNRVIIDRSIILLLSAAKACLRHPDCDKARETRDSVLLQIKASMSIIMAIIKQSVFSDQMQPAAAQQQQLHQLQQLQQRSANQPLHQLDTNIVHNNHNHYPNHYHPQQQQQLQHQHVQQPSSVLMSQLVKRYVDHHNNNPTNNNNNNSDILDPCNTATKTVATAATTTISTPVATAVAAVHNGFQDIHSCYRNSQLDGQSTGKNSYPLLPYSMSLLEFQNHTANNNNNNTNNNKLCNNQQHKQQQQQQQQQQSSASIQYCALQILNWFLNGPNNISTAHVAISELQLLIEPLRHASSVHHLSRIIASLAHLIKSDHQQCNANTNNNLSRQTDNNNNSMSRSSYLWSAKNLHQNRNHHHHQSDIINTSTDSSSSSGQTTLEAAALESDILMQHQNNSTMIDHHDSASLRLNELSTITSAPTTTTTSASAIQQQQQQQYASRNVARPTLHRQQHTTAPNYINDLNNITTKHTTTGDLIFHDNNTNQNNNNNNNFTTTLDSGGHQVITANSGVNLHHNNHKAVLMGESFDERHFDERRRRSQHQNRATIDDTTAIDHDYSDEFDEDESLLLENVDEDDFDDDDDDEDDDDDDDVDDDVDEVGLVLADENTPDIISDHYHHRTRTSKQHNNPASARRRRRLPIERSIYLKALNTLIEVTQEFTDCAYTGHEHRENILILNDCIRMQINQLIRMISLLKRGFIQDRQVNLNQMRHLANQIIDSCNELKYELQTVAIEQSDELDRLNGQLNILKRLKHCCLGGDMDRLARTSRDFLDHGEHLVEICKLLNQVVPTHKLKISTQTLINWFGNNSRQIINASNCLCLNSRSKIARDHLWAYLQVWSSFYEDFCQIARQLAYMARSFDNGNTVTHQQRQSGGYQIIREQLLMKRQLLLQQQQQHKYDSLMAASNNRQLRQQLRAALYNEQQQQQQTNNSNSVSSRRLGTNSTSFHDLRSILCEQQPGNKQQLTGEQRDDNSFNQVMYNMDIMANEHKNTCSEQNSLGSHHRQQQQQQQQQQQMAYNPSMYCRSSGPEMETHLMAAALNDGSSASATHQHALIRRSGQSNYLGGGPMNLAQSHDLALNPMMPTMMRANNSAAKQHADNHLQQQSPMTGATDGAMTVMSSGNSIRQQQQQQQVLPKSSLKQTSATEHQQRIQQQQQQQQQHNHDYDQPSGSANTGQYPLPAMASGQYQQHQPASEMLQTTRPLRERVVTINESASKVYHHNSMATTAHQHHLEQDEDTSLHQQHQHQHHYNNNELVQRQSIMGQQLSGATRSNSARTGVALDNSSHGGNGPVAVGAVPAPLSIVPPAPSSAAAAVAAGGLTTPPGSVAGDSEQGGATDQQSSTTDADKWSDSEDNDIVQIARATAQMAYSMYQFTRGEGELNTTQDLFTQAELFAEESNELYKDVRRFSYDVPAGNLKKELLSNLDLIPTLVQQLQFTVKNPTVGKPATFTKVDNVIRETRALMEAVNKVVNSSIACRQHYNMGTQSMRKRSRTLSPSYRSDESFEFEAQSSARTGMNSRSAGGGTGSEPDI